MIAGRKRVLALALTGLAILAVVLLSAGLATVDLLPGHPLPLFGQSLGVPTGGVGDMPGAEMLRIIVAALSILTVVLMPFALIQLLVSSEARRRVLKDLVVVLLLVAFYLVMRNRTAFLQQIQMAPLANAPLGGAATPSVIPVTTPPQWLTWVITFGLPLLVATGLVAFLWLLWQRTRRPAGPLDELARQAQVAIDSIWAGADIRDTVMRCYFEMSRVLDEQRGLRRGKDMTPREFEIHLRQAGLPDEQIAQLTRLFERVRYGARIASKEDEQQAIACLTEIVESCRGPA